MNEETGRLEVQQAAECNAVGKLKKLIKPGADIDVPNRTGITPLMYAAYNGNIECMKLLLVAGADIKNYDEKTALDILKFNSIKKYDRYAGELCRLYDTVSSRRLKKEDVLKAVRTGYEFDI